MSNLLRDECNIFFTEDGSSEGPPVVLIHGIGCQLVQWPDSFVQGLVVAGFYVIRLDNRDAGLSGEIDAPVPDPLQIMDDPSSSPYKLRDMAEDTIALLDHLKVKKGHIVGVSMGGMIAQRLAIHYPDRVASLTSIMSTTGMEDSPAAPEVTELLLQRPQNAEFEELLAGSRLMWDFIGGEVYKSTELGIGLLAEKSLRRSYRPDGFTRQLAAIISDGSRQEELANIQVPTLVIHGSVDPLVPPVGGKSTAKSIRGAKLHMFPDMGHDLPEPLIPDIIELLIKHIKS